MAKKKRQYKMAKNIEVSEWMARETNLLTHDYSLPYIQDKFKNINWILVRKWIEDNKPDLKNIRLEEILQAINKHRKIGK